MYSVLYSLYSCTKLMQINTTNYLPTYIKICMTLNLIKLL